MHMAGLLSRLPMNTSNSETVYCENHVYLVHLYSLTKIEFHTKIEFLFTRCNLLRTSLQRQSH